MEDSEKIIDGLMALLRVALGNEAPGAVGFDFGGLGLDDWKALKKLSVRQCVPAIVLDGVQALVQEGVDVHPEIDEEGWSVFYLGWVGLVMRMEQEYEGYAHSLRHLAELYGSHGFRMMVLKGYGLSLNYPRPNHRPTGDLDIYLFGRQQEGDEMLRREGIEVDTSHHHHTTFVFEGLFVENHYDFLNLYSHLGNRRVEKELRKRCWACRPDPEMPNVYYPTNDFNTLFLLRHMGAHFAAEKMTLRQLLDWALSPQVDMDEEFGMHEYRQIVNAICNGKLGFELPVEEVDAALVERVFADMMHPYERDHLTLWFRLRRWFANRWKNRLFYQENLFATFWVQLWSHIVRPLGHAE